MTHTRPRNLTPRAALAALGLVTLHLAAGAACGQVVNQITKVEPNTAPAGTANLVVTFTLDTDAPPAPPANVAPTSVTLGGLTGAAVAHVSQYVVTATFNIPAGEALGAKDASIAFATPNGTVTFSILGGFTVTGGAHVAPSITQQPQAQTVAPGGFVAFTVAANGTAPLHYQWRKGATDIDGATSATYTLNPVATSAAGSYRCNVTNDYGAALSDAAVLTVSASAFGAYPIVDTGANLCYNATSAIACPTAGQAFYGQDAQFAGHAPSYTRSADGLTVCDNVTGLTWQHSPETTGDGVLTAADKLSWANAQLRPAALNAVNFGGYSDWRLPTIKELYSLIDFRGTDPSGYTGTDTTVLTPFIDTTAFQFAYGQTSAGERIIDSQYASRTLYVSTSFGQDLFGVNFADGRIKGYGLTINGADKTFFVQCVRGNPSYGVNDFADNGDGTITDRATGLQWTQADSGTALNWQAALAWVQSQNETDYLGHNDWRLPNVKELQSLLDYTRSPDTTGSAAIHPLFACTAIVNEGGQADYPWYWSSTTHAAYGGAGEAGSYVCFGRALGWMQVGGATCYSLVDVHGAGAQRSDPKSGSPTSYYLGATCSGGAAYGRGPQGDVIRVANFVRLVRTAPAVVRGDLNCDGQVDFTDINPFVQLLSDRPAWQSAHPGCAWANGDCNGDGAVDFADINPFVALLSGP